MPARRRRYKSSGRPFHITHPELIHLACIPVLPTLRSPQVPPEQRKSPPSATPKVVAKGMGENRNPSHYLRITGQSITPLVHFHGDLFWDRPAFLTSKFRGLARYSLSVQPPPSIFKT